MMTEIITIGVMLGIFIAMVVVNYLQMKQTRRDGRAYLQTQNDIATRAVRDFSETLSRIDKSDTSRLVITNEAFANHSKTIKEFIDEFKKVSNTNRKDIEDFIELCDNDYKKQIKQLEVNERFATKQLTEYYMAVRSLDDNYKKKIQFRLDKMLDKKDGKDKKMPITKTNGGK